MIDTETYLTHMKSDFSRRVAADFIVCFGMFALSCMLSYIAVRIFSPTTVYVLSSPITKGSAGRVISGILASQLPSAVALLVLFFSVFTVINRWITVLVCLWKGASLGATACLMVSGAVRGMSATWAWALAVYFFASVVFASLAALSRVYSEVICHTGAAGERRYTASLVMEYVKLFFIISGGIFLLGSISTILI